MASLLTLLDLSLHFGGPAILDKVNLQLEAGERVCLVGRNGAGKTTLMKVIMGDMKPDTGDVFRAQGAVFARLAQEVPPDLRSSVHDIVASGLRPNDDGHEEDWRRDIRVEDLIRDAGLEAGRGFQELSGGLKRRALLARALAGQPDLLLLDEPTNHLDLESIIWLEQFLKGFNGALLMTSHDREFMNRIVSKIAEIDAGEITLYSGNYDFYERERAIRENNQQAAFARQQSMLAKEQRFIERFKTHAAKAAQVQSRIKALDKIEKIELPKKRTIVKFEFRVPARSGDQVAVMEDLKKSYGPRVIYDGFSLTIRRGERWAVMGRNGAGKTTLLKMIAGASKPDSGHVQLGASLTMGYFAQQSLDVLNPDLTILEQLQQDFPQDGIGSLRSLAGAFQFSGDDVDKKIRALSGGEKSRLAMARMLYNPPNFLVLDEPTNHLDLATKEMLIDALKDFEGTMIFVSHDRTFLRGLGSRVLELGGESGKGRTPRVYPGSYIEYVQNIGHEAPGIYA